MPIHQYLVGGGDTANWIWSPRLPSGGRESCEIDGLISSPAPDQSAESAVCFYLLSVCTFARGRLHTHTHTPAKRSEMPSLALLQNRPRCQSPENYFAVYMVVVVVFEGATCLGLATALLPSSSPLHLL